MHPSMSEIIITEHLEDLRAVARREREAVRATAAGALAARQAAAPRRPSRAHVATQPLSLMVGRLRTWLSRSTMGPLPDGACAPDRATRW